LSPIAPDCESCKFENAEKAKKGEKAKIVEKAEFYCKI
jgi:hypothetical protein